MPRYKVKHVYKYQIDWTDIEAVSQKEALEIAQEELLENQDLVEDAAEEEWSVEEIGEEIKNG